MSHWISHLGALACDSDQEQEQEHDLEGTFQNHQVLLLFLFQSVILSCVFSTLICGWNRSD